MLGRVALGVVLALGLVAVPLAGGAQQVGKTYQVGLVSMAVDPTGPPTPLWRAFGEAMRELNYVEGRNLVLRRAFAGGRRERLPDLVNELVQSKVDVLVTSASGETQAAKRATSTIPIVMTVAADPVREGLVASLARPGGNVTGLTSLIPGLSQKYVELLREVIVSAPRFAVIAGPRAPGPELRRELQTAADHLGSVISFWEVKGPDEFDGVLARAKQEGAAGIIVALDAVTYLHRKRLVDTALKHRLPGIYWSREFAEAGGLMSYGANVQELGRHAARYVDRILKGARPADLPVEQPTKFELVINLRTARTLGLAIPQSVLLRADEIIE
jgi:putative tryptophan/tyrosine transport system substrate-binding protein